MRTKIKTINERNRKETKSFETMTTATVLTNTIMREIRIETMKKRIRRK